MITLTVKEWTGIRKKIKEDYRWKPSVMMIRSSMRDELGFTPRLHSEWNESKHRLEETVFLDFYNNEKETLFRLKYL